MDGSFRNRNSKWNFSTDTRKTNSRFMQKQKDILIRFSVLKK